MPRKKKKWNKETIQELLSSNKQAVLKAIVTIYRFQTREERNCSETVDWNGVGFSTYDAQILTEYAKKINRNIPLSDKEFAIGRYRVKKYWKQLAKIANENEEKREHVEVKIQEEIKEQIQSYYDSVDSCDNCYYGCCEDCTKKFSV